jgi:hypothetical protein
MNLLHCFLLTLILPAIVLCQSDSIVVRESSSKSDKGHWLLVTTGRTVAGNGGDQWLVVAGYDGRIGNHFSFPIETYFVQDAARPLKWWLVVSGGLKERVRIPSIGATLHAQCGIGFGMAGSVFHFGGGCDVQLIDRLSLTIQARRFASGEHPGQTFLSLGVSINTTSNRLRELYDAPSN